MQLIFLIWNVLCFRLVGKKQRLLEIFAGWCDNVIDLILATDEEAILRRDIYDRRPSFTWGRGRVTLLGDSIHAMQPNMGQGGCMAIEVKLICFLAARCRYTHILVIPSGLLVS